MQSTSLHAPRASFTNISGPSLLPSSHYTMIKPKMVEPVAKIRSYRIEDEKQVRFVIAKAAMEGLASANKKTILNPLSLSLWVLLTGLLIQFMGWWPKSGDGILAYISLMLPFGSAAVPVILFSDWNNRWYFDDLSQHVLRGPDMINLQEYYSKSPASGLWILEFAGRLVGIIALDASPFDKINSNQKVHDTAILRHIYVDEQYRPTGIQKDLINYALQNAFTTSNSAVTQVKASSSPLRDYVRKALDETGFKYEGVSENIGLFRWKMSNRVLTKDEWKKKITLDAK
ncbi:hypothetical protein F5890DRAFT_1508703 [Lentinula detonsa]|uniref:N-acetyltransferase domain-containing protein n=1 Tax=Lentinula detonsa TaxID=2804962 RepID=A0AA38Q2P7_9AGAR|nr:hypothetical protein F5890DRAFT_1508703 [Lentinula detonsa]